MHPISRYSLIFCSLVLIVTAFKFYPRWEKTGSESTLSWDASGYYMYLPALFIYKDIRKCNFKDSILQKYRPTPDFQQAYLHEISGNYVMKYSSGLALVSIPFFAVGHLWALSSDNYPADGFSYPYKVSIGIGLFLFSLIGIFYLRKVLLRYYKDKTVAILLLLLVIGTNYINYAAVDQAMTHSTLFTIYVLLIWNSIRFYETLQWKNALAIGILTGLATLIRPTEMIAILLPLFWGISSWTTFKERMTLVLNHYHKYLVAAFLFCCVLFIQPLYWKYATGEWLVYSYGEQGFSWLRPHVYDYILSYCCGWLRYTPMMLMPIFGLWVFYKNKVNTIPVIGFILISFYLVTAWDIWDYGGTAGRAMIQYYPVLAFLFAALIEAADQKKWYQYILYPVLVFFTYLNVWWVYHAHRGQVQALELSSAYYWAKVGRWTANEEDKKLLDNKYVFRNIPKNPVLIYKNDFENDTSVQIVERDGNRQIRMNLETQYSPAFAIEHQNQFKEWIRVKAKFSCTYKEWDLWRQTQFIVKFYSGEQEIQSNMIRIYRFISDGESKEIYLDTKTPKSFTKISIFFWHAGSDKELWIDDLEVITFDD
jgi:hypothetical protein